MTGRAPAEAPQVPGSGGTARSSGGPIGAVVRRDRAPSVNRVPEELPPLDEAGSPRTAFIASERCRAEREAGYAGSASPAPAVEVPLRPAFSPCSS
jgi:hypothetical protein